MRENIATPSSDTWKIIFPKEKDDDLRGIYFVGKQLRTKMIYAMKLFTDR